MLSAAGDEWAPLVESTRCHVSTSGSIELWMEVTWRKMKMMLKLWPSALVTLLPLEAGFQSGLLGWAGTGAGAPVLTGFCCFTLCGFS